MRRSRHETLIVLIGVDECIGDQAQALLQCCQVNRLCGMPGTDLSDPPYFVAIFFKSPVPASGLKRLT